MAYLQVLLDRVSPYNLVDLISRVPAAFDLISRVPAAFKNISTCCIGSGVRREYTVLGDIVNRSARLMQAANNGILVCKDTHLCCVARALVLCPNKWASRIPFDPWSVCVINSVRYDSHQLIGMNPKLLHKVVKFLKTRVGFLTLL